MDDKVLSVRDALVTDFVKLNSAQTVAQAREKLNKAGVTYGVVTDAADIPLKLITSGALADIMEQDIQLKDVFTVPAFIVSPETLLDQTVLFSSQTLVENPEMAGLIVENQGIVVGVLPRQVISKHARRIKNRRGDIKDLAGVPQVWAKYFICPKQDYKKLIIRYDPDDPPTCPYHNLILLEQP